MSVQQYLDWDLAGRRRSRELKTLFRAHESPTFYHLTRRAAGLLEDGEPNVSLANCEKVPTSTEPDHVTDATEALRMAISRSRDRQRKVLALLDVDEAAHAKRLATCRRQSVQLECATEFGAGGCGSKDNYVPISCDSRICPGCMKGKMGEVAGQYRPVVEGWDHPTAIRLSLHRRVGSDELEQAVDALRGAHRRLRRRVVPADGDGWAWAEWKRSLRMVGRKNLARRWQKRYADQGKGIPVDEIIPTGFYGIDIKQGDDGSLNVHMHILADVPWFPQAALSALWDDLTAAPVVDVRRVDGDREGALMDAIGYAAKAPEFNSLEDEIAYLQTLKGSKLIQPFGDLHGNTPPTAAVLLCGECGKTPRWWNYLGTVDGCYNTVEVSEEGGGGPPPP